MEKKDNSKQIILSVLGVAILIIAVVGVSFAAFTFAEAGTEENVITTGTVSMTYTETSNGISITNAMPMADASGKALTGANNTFSFTVSGSVSGTANINYEVAAIKSADSTLGEGDVKLYLTKNGSEALAPTIFTPVSGETAVGTPEDAMILASGTFTTGITTDSYMLRMWMADTASVSATSEKFAVNVNVYAKAAATP